MDKFSIITESIEISFVMVAPTNESLISSVEKPIQKYNQIENILRITGSSIMLTFGNFRLWTLFRREKED